MSTVKTLEAMLNGEKIILSRNICVSCQSLKDRYKGDIEIIDTLFGEQKEINQFLAVPFIQYPVLVTKKDDFFDLKENVKTEFLESLNEEE